MGKKDKKKGKGVEKTIAKTEKKLAQKMKKKLALTGEDDIEDIVTKIEKEGLKKPLAVQKLEGPPSRRVFCSLTPHPTKDELIMFGGEFHNGQTTLVYNNLYIYKINTNEWLEIIAPGSPPPRSAHRAVATPANKGELWVFGGEFTTKSESQFHHFKDLWLFELEEKKWTKVVAPGGPSARSGHCMVLYKRNLIVFGGYHDNLQDYKYFNDLYSFSLDDRAWTKIQPTGTAPAPRSGCKMAVTPEGKILIWGGYSKTKVKKDVDQGTTFTDMFLLSPEKGDESGLKWKWSVVKPGGVKPGMRSGVSATFSGKRAYTFGGSCDHETEEDMTAEFYNELHTLDLSKFIWSEVALSQKKDSNKTRRRKQNKDDMEGMDVEEQVDEEKVVVNDGVFEVRIGPAPTQSADTSGASCTAGSGHPHPRINCSLAMKGSKLFLYGGSFEDEQMIHTLSDFYSIDTHKMDEWKTLIPCELNQEWVESEDEGEESESDSASDDDDSDSESESDMDAD